MAQPTIIWTFLPNGIDKGRLKFSAVPSFRLPEEAGKNPNLGLFPEILNWPETLTAVAFSAEVEKGPAFEAKRTSPMCRPSSLNSTSRRPWIPPRNRLRSRRCSVPKLWARSG
jgi:hypothetical protein